MSLGKTCQISECFRKSTVDVKYILEFLRKFLIKFLKTISGLQKVLTLF